MADIFDEVNEDLRAERAQRLFQRYGALLIVAAVLIVAAAGAWQFWRHRQAQAREAVAAEYLTAMRGAGTPLGGAAPARAEAEKAFAAIATNGPGGYRTLARLHEAALKASSGDLPGALALWDQVSADEGADPQLRQLADLLWVQHQVDRGDPAAVEGRLAPLLAADNPWRPLAQESEAWLKLRTGDTKAAVTLLRQIAAAQNAPPGVRDRATALLVQLGQPPDGSDPEIGG